MAESVKQTLLRDAQNNNKSQYSLYTFEKLINELSPNQIAIPTVSINNVEVTRKVKIVNKLKNVELPSWFTNYLKQNNIDLNLYVEKMNKDSFLMSILYLLNSEYRMMNDKKRQVNLMEMKKILGIEMEEKDYHRIFHYTRKRKFKKDIMMKWLIKPEQDWDNMTITEQGVYQYIVDYFSLNVIIFQISATNVPYLECLLANINEPCAYRPTVLLIRMNGMYYPLMDKLNVDGYYLWSKNEWLHKLYEQLNKKYKINYESQKIEVIDNNISNITGDNVDGESNDDDVEDESKKETEVNKISVYNEIDLKKYTLKQLQDLAAEHKILITKISAISGKQINKKKEDLIEELINM